MLLSVCIVVRDKARYLAKTISSVKNLADEIIIVDLNSIDNSGTVASILGARVYYLQETFDLCYSRNFARKKAKGQWVLFLEAGEELLDDYKQLTPMLKDINQDGYYLPVTDLDYINKRNIQDREVDNLNLPRLSLRLYQNKENYNYNNDSHQSITNSILKSNGEASLKVLHLPIVRNFSYTIFPDDIRPINLFYLEVDQDMPIEEEPFKYLKEGIKSFWKKEHSQAISVLDNGYLKVKGKYKPTILQDLVLILLEDKQYQRAEKKVSIGLREFPNYSIFKFWQGYLEYINGKFREAIDKFNYILENNFIDKDKRTTGNTQLLLGLAYLADANWQKAEFHLEKALKSYNSNRLIINILLEIKDLELDEIYEYFQLDCPGNRKRFFSVIECLYFRKEYNLMEELLQKQTNLREDDNLLLYWQGLIYFKEERYNFALKYLKKVTPDFIHYKDVLHLQWILNLNMPGHFESKSVVNQIKLLGDKINWNLINFFNEIYFYEREVFFKFDNLVAKLKFYNRALHFLGYLIEYGTSKAIIIMLEIIDKLQFERSDRDVGLLFYIHGYWEQAYEYLNKSQSLKDIGSLPEVSIMSEVCRHLGKHSEERNWNEKANLLDLYKEINVHCRNFAVLVEY